MVAQGYIGRNPGDSSVVISRQSFTASGITTDFTFASGYTVGYFDLYINGVRLIEGTDYTASDSATFAVLNGGAQDGDVLEGVAYKAFNLGDTYTSRVGIQSAGIAIGNAETLNFVGTGNTFSVNGTTIDVSISGSAGAGGTWTTYDSNTGITTTKKVKIDNNLEVTGVTTSTDGFSGNLTGNVTGNADTATTAGIATYAETAGIATYAGTAGIATYAGTAGIATYAGTAGVSTVAQGLTGTPNIVVGIATLGTVKISSGIVTATSGIVTYYGDGSNLTGIEVGLTTEALVANNSVVTLDLTKQDHKITATGICTITVTGGTEANSHTVRLINSGIATVGFSTYFLFPSGATPSLPEADGSISLLSFTVNKVGAGGTQLLTGASLNYS
jgi:hypothetical protein